MKEITILEAEYNELKACRQMLSQISLYIEDFCEEEDTTLVGVLKVLAEYHTMKSNELYEKINILQES
jgi:hypothetical protein